MVENLVVGVFVLKSREREMHGGPLGSSISHMIACYLVLAQV